MITLEQIEFAGENHYFLNIDGDRTYLEPERFVSVTVDDFVARDDLRKGLPDIELTIRLDKIDYKEVSPVRALLNYLKEQE